MNDLPARIRAVLAQTRRAVPGAYRLMPPACPALLEEAADEIARLTAERPGLVREAFRAGVSLAECGRGYHETRDGPPHEVCPDEDATVARLTGEG